MKNVKAVKEGKKKWTKENKEIELEEVNELKKNVEHLDLMVGSLSYPLPNMKIANLGRNGQ